MLRLITDPVLDIRLLCFLACKTQPICPLWSALLCAKMLTTESVRIRKIRPSGMRGGLAETWAMVGAKRARKAETPKQPSLCLMLRAPYFYPTNQAELRKQTVPCHGRRNQPTRILSENLVHFHRERNHQGKANVLLFPATTQAKNGVDGSVGCKERLGGLIKYYHREAA